MSSKWTRLGLAALLATVPLAQLAAQDYAVTADEAIDQARRTYGPPAPRKDCNKNKQDKDKNGEIVVCAEQQQDYSEFRVKSSRELDPNSKEAQADGLPRAPDVAGAGIFQGNAITLGSKPQPALMIDFSLLPDTPPGSDADKVGKGEKGN